MQQCWLEKQNKKQSRDNLQNEINGRPAGHMTQTTAKHLSSDCRLRALLVLRLKGLISRTSRRWRCERLQLIGFQPTDGTLRVV